MTAFGLFFIVSSCKSNLIRGTNPPAAEQSVSFPCKNPGPHSLQIGISLLRHSRRYSSASRRSISSSFVLQLVAKRTTVWSSSFFSHFSHTAASEILS